MTSGRAPPASPPEPCTPCLPLFGVFRSKDSQSSLWLAQPAASAGTWRLQAPACPLAHEGSVGCFPASVQESQASVLHMSGCHPYLCIQPLGAQPAREVFTLQHTCPAQGPRGAGGVKSPRNCQYQAAREVPSLCRFNMGAEAECLRVEADKRQPVLSPGERRAWGSCSATWVGRELQSGVRPQALPLVELCSPNMVV